MLEAIVAGHGYEAAPAVVHGEEYLRGSVVPNLHRVAQK